ncbi:MinD/ParA family protein [Paenibacillus sp. UNC499MF]|uniref:MinD/ParA family protein n=1 Tax=Paenibacillus sp. UNC499MF TaxID=1502751 RepID=UPI00089FDF88|nr:MinD/ParA family protein [Paenibacillus sp. UNC499MF]SEF58415.1 flagellar biosynthesis protein FlhG [Paenibacillus sp. UNC499MF]
MSDQAQELRNLIRLRHEKDAPSPGGALTGGPERKTRIITVTSGKGGVGKSNFTLNFGLCLQARGYKTLIFDADIGFANIDVLMGISSKANLLHLIKGEKTIGELVQTGPKGLQFIAGGSGLYDLVRLSDSEADSFTEQIQELGGMADFILFDTGAGLSKETQRFIAAAQETLVVTTPEPTSITDAYALIKMVRSEDPGVAFKLVVNRAAHGREARETAEKIAMVARRFLSVELQTLGFVEDDHHVSRAVKEQTPFTIAYPNSPAAKSMNVLVDQFLGQQPKADSTGGFKGFLSRLIGR